MKIFKIMKTSTFLLLMIVTSTLQTPQKIPIAWKYMGELAPNNIDGHLNIQIPLAAIHNHIQNIRKEHEENKKKRGKTSFSKKSTKKCLDDCKPNNNGVFDCMVNASYKTREQCENYEDKELVKMENLEIEKLEHKCKSMMRNVALNNEQLQRKKRFAFTAIFTILGIGITSLIAGYNAIKIQELARKNQILEQNDFLFANSLETIFKHQTESNHNINALKNASHEIILFEEGQARRLQFLELDIVRSKHTNFNYKTADEALDVSNAIINSMFDGHLSNRIAEIHDIEGAHSNFVKKATKNGYTPAAGKYNQLFHMKTSYIIEQESLTVHLYVHIPLLRKGGVMQMVQYQPSQIPISDQYGMKILGHHDILAYDDEFFVSLHSNDLWKCQKLSTVHFCNSIINSLKPKSQMENNCLGALKLEKPNKIMENCRHKRLSPLKTDVKRINSHKYMIFSTKEDSVTIVCVNKYGKSSAKNEFIPANVHKELLLEDQCKGIMSDGSMLYPDINFDSEENYISFNLPFEKDNITQILPGMTETKLDDAMAYLHEVQTDVDVTELHQFSKMIHKNLQFNSRMDNQSSFSNIVLVVAISGILQGLLFGAISYYILSKKINNVDTDVKGIKKILPGADVE